MTDGMTHREFQGYLGLLSRMLRLRAAQREGVEDELRAHMEERFAALSAQGIEPEQAVSMALAEFGDAAALAAEFSAISRLRKRRWMMRFTIGSIAATILLTAVVVSMWPDGPGELADTAAHAQQVKKAPPAKAAKPAPKQDANANTQARLETHVDAEFQETPLNDVLDFLAEKAGVQVYIDLVALDDVGLTAESPKELPVTINLKDVPVEMVLRLALRLFDLAYMLDNGVVIVSTPEEVEVNLETHVYRVSDLLDEAADKNAGPPGAEYDEAPGLGGPMRRVQLYGEIGRLIDLITAAVEPTSWDTVGGPGTVVPYRGALVIAQTYQVHRKVEKLLQGLREALAKQPVLAKQATEAVPAP